MPILRDDKERLMIPIDYAIAFPNIGRREFIEKKFDQLIPLDHILFKDKLIKSKFYQEYEKLLPKLNISHYALI
ncbi:hypothetical protein U27_06892 [Candidatus Vecturithrix granuli]|uniref:Uncharacterized protein n=1 Tax=Vecturithrix granuli TaxID=1499967 RepID=A0A081C5Q1_VECG1|nr:hypothetical protein U27_06892 [Candidatus Vecturithrix granuli]